MTRPTAMAPDASTSPVGQSEANPYLIEGPALISFSGGRTSAYMLKMMLDAAGGAFAPDIHVGFANTGKEREETLRFYVPSASALASAGSTSASASLDPTRAASLSWRHDADTA